MLERNLSDGDLDASLDMNSPQRQHLQLNDGSKMPIIGLGTWQGRREEIRCAVKNALRVGYRLVDTAYAYRNEWDIGQAIEEAILDEKLLKRSDLFLATKLPPNGMRADHVEHFLRQSLNNLRVDYVDLYLIHAPFGFQHVKDGDSFPVDAAGLALVDNTTDLVAVWKKMEEMVDKGLTKSIGVSNFCPEQLDRILATCRIKPVVNQVEYHAYLQQRHLLEYCAKRNVALCAYSPMGSPGAYVFMNAIGNSEFRFPNILEDPTIKELSIKHSHTPAQILLKFLIQQGIAVIPKSVNPIRIKENFHLFNFTLSPEDMKEIEKINKHARVFDFEHCKGFWGNLLSEVPVFVFLPILPPPSTLQILLKTIPHYNLAPAVIQLHVAGLQKK